MAKKEILIVEDQEELLKLECILLASRGYQVKGVLDGTAALDYMTRNKPDLVLLDVMLPGVDGFEVCRLIKNNEATKTTQVILLTAKNSREDFLRGEQVGADGYMTKPFRSAMVVETIKRHLADDPKPSLGFF